jgi:hypothetical protein
MTGADDRGTELERQRAAVEAEFRGGLVPVSDRDASRPASRRPLIDGVGADVEVVIIGHGDEGHRVAVLFSHQGFPGLRFGHRFPSASSPTARYASIWLKEEVETGALNRMMREPPVPDDAGIIWTTW